MLQSRVNSCVGCRRWRDSNPQIPKHTTPGPNNSSIRAHDKQTSPAKLPIPSTEPWIRIWQSSARPVSRYSAITMPEKDKTMNAHTGNKNK